MHIYAFTPGVHNSEKHQCLLASHFGGHPGRTTTDSMHLVVNRIKNAWQHKRVTVMLFLDIEGVFPNAVMEQLLHNMQKQHIPEQYILFIAQMLKDWWTKFKFNNYKSDWVNIDNGIRQGNHDTIPILQCWPNRCHILLPSICSDICQQDQPICM